jgi:hypothetical protein
MAAIFWVPRVFASTFIIVGVTTDGNRLPGALFPEEFADFCSEEN